MNLRSDASAWTTPQPLTTAPLDRDTVADVAIIGSGISGALTAYYLTQTQGPGLRPRRVVMLDKRDVSAGSVGGSTALLQYEMDTTLVDLSAKVGRRRAERAYQLCLEALGHFDAISHDLGGGCGYLRRQSLYLSGTDANAAELYAESHARRAAGIKVEYLDRTRLRSGFGIDRAAALLSRDAAEVDPVCLTRRLLERSVDQGLTIHGRTGVAKYEPTADGVTLTTDAGHTVTAGRVIFCTGYETEDFLGQSYVRLNSTFAVVSEPVADPAHDFAAWPDRCLVWEAQTPYFYCRTTADHRVIIGGEDEPTTDAAERDAMLPAKTEKLVAQFRRMFPTVPFTPAKSWAGTFAESHDGLPYIGTHPRFPNGYFALGYGGNGITFALIAARLLADELAGRPSPDAGLFAFDRGQVAQPLVVSG